MWLDSFLLVILVTTALGFQPPWMFMGRPLSGFRQINDIDSINATEPEMVDQFLDHFDKNITIWKQRYWKNDKFNTEENGINFLILGGESEATSFDILYEKYPHVQYAKELKATLWTLEHRFYGESQPFKNLEIKNLQYLNTHQALADIAHFIHSQNAAQNLTNPQWIIFGGSYAGSLALWFKEIYPDLSKGAVASSAPINVRLDFYDHIKYTEHLIQSYSPECAENIKTVFKNFEKFLTSDNDFKRIMSRSFPLNPYLQTMNLTYDSISFLYSNIISYIQTAIQYTNVNAKAFKNDVGIISLCQNMVYQYPEDQRYLNLATSIREIQKSLTGAAYGIDINYNDFISYLRESNSKDVHQRALRAWTWQTCNEFGNCLSTNAAKSIFGNRISYKEYSMIKTQTGIHKIKNAYGTSSTYNGTNIIASKNYYDPWSLLALTKLNDPNVITYEINGTGHCADMAPISDDDNESLIEYRKLVLKTIQKWIE